MLGRVDGEGGFLSEVLHGKGSLGERLARASGEAGRRRELVRAAREERRPTREPQLERLAPRGRD